MDFFHNSIYLIFYLNWTQFFFLYARIEQEKRDNCHPNPKKLFKTHGKQ